MLSQYLCMLMAFCYTMASPMHAEKHGNTWQYGFGGGVLGFITLVLDVIIFVEVINSTRPVLHKLLWCVGVFLFPILGAIVYFLFSNRAAHRAGSGYEAIP